MEIRLTDDRKGHSCARMNLAVSTAVPFLMAAQWCAPVRRQHAWMAGSNPPSGMPEAAHRMTASAVDMDRRIGRGDVISFARVVPLCRASCQRATALSALVCNIL